MREFRDNEGARWQVSLTVASAARVRDLVRVTPPSVDGQPTAEKAFDIIDAAAVAETFQILRMNYVAIGETLYALLLPRITERGLSKEAFLDTLSGESLDAGARAIEEEIVNFFPPRLRGMVSALLARMRELSEAVVTQAEADVRKMPLPLPPGTSSGSAPESSESTPASGPSGS